MATFSSPGVFWPLLATLPSNALAGGTNVTLNTANYKVAYVGRIYIDGRPAAAKTFSTSGTIGFRCGAVTFADAATRLSVGIQGVSTSAGPGPTPDGSYTVSATLQTGGVTPSANAFNTITMTTGSASITHGDLIAVVLDMTAKGGSDSVVITPARGIGTGTMPSVMAYTTSWPANSSADLPNVLITFDDGTLATLDGSVPFNTGVTEQYADATNPDERGVTFQVPFTCAVDAIWMCLNPNDATADLTMSLYADPLGTPSSIASVAIDANTVGIAGTTRLTMVTLAAPVNLAANTTYCVAAKATGAGLVNLPSLTLASATHRALHPGGTALSKVTRDGSSGAFSPTTTTVYMGGVRISSISSGYERGRVVNAGGGI